ncbi:Serine/threonine-protein kinase AFC2 [Tripterygium wilfordii]|uniref:Serine/threonine-protein kinase AFC2 n=1 Tax=Tripterygium wilfordii TaxID=458696 RepID=A0A7J7D442_TRIWF|nr:Serine/threonine-protein kinase AFC2 [Tripterygium wilfordii]
MAIRARVIIESIDRVGLGLESNGDGIFHGISSQLHGSSSQRPRVGWELPQAQQKGLALKGSPPWRDDDKDGHYIFALGEKLTSRYKIHRKIGEVVYKYGTEYVKIPDYKVTPRSPTEGLCYKRLPKSSAIQVIDIGSTAYEEQDHNYIVSTRHYRGPEVILGLGWSYPCDIWSAGCFLVELCSGEALFQTHENLEHLAMMERVLGPLPPHMLKRADRHAEKYVRRGRLDWPDGATSRESIRAVLKLP